MPLTAKQRRFVVEYLRDGNATQAAIRAGYSAHTAKSIGQENLTKPVIAAAIAEGTQRLEQPRVADAAERRAFLTALVRNAEIETRDRIKASDQLNRMDGVYVQKVDVTHRTKHDLTRLSPAELAQLESVLAKSEETPEAVH